MSKLRTPVSAADQSTANLESENILVEYGDYQCPHCGHAHPLLKKLIKEKGSEFRFVFRNFPLQESHPLAFMAATAAEAAGKQGKFWEMHDLIFEHQSQLNKYAITAYADKLGLNSTQFEQDLNSEAITQKVDDDFESGVRSGVNGTPSFFINGVLVDYDGTYRSLLQAVELINR